MLYNTHSITLAAYCVYTSVIDLYNRHCSVHVNVTEPDKVLDTNDCLNLRISRVMRQTAEDCKKSEKNIKPF